MLERILTEVFSIIKENSTENYKKNESIKSLQDELEECKVEYSKTENKNCIQKITELKLDNNELIKGRIELLKNYNDLLIKYNSLEDNNSNLRHYQEIDEK